MVKKICLCDFDGTIALLDLAFLVVKRFANKEWEHYEQLFNANKLSLEDTVSAQYSLIQASEETILESVGDSFEIRDNFSQFIQYCQTTNVPILVVSGGIDFVIRHVLDKIGIPRAIELIAMKTEYQEDGTIKVTRPKRYHENSIDFKHDLVQYYKQQGYYVYYIGDGSSDYGAVKEADLTFTVSDSKLAEFCKDNNLQHVEFSDFKEIIDYLQVQKE